MKKSLSLALTALLLMTGLLGGCHASEDDPAGLAEELSDAIRRQHSIEHIKRLYTRALSEHDGDRSHPEVQAIADATIGPLTECFINSREDIPNGLEILRTMEEMRDPRSLPALIAALDWRLEVSEQHAITAANTLRYTDIPPGEKARVIEAISQAYEEIGDARPLDNNMRQNFIRAIGAMRDQSATATLSRIVTDVSEGQNFLYNIYAGHQLAELEDPAAIPAFIKALFLFPPNNPGMRMNDVGQNGLVRIGRASIPALLEVINGENEEAIALATAFRDALPPAAQAMVQVGDEVSKEAVTVLGSLGLEEAWEPVMRETQVESPFRRTNGAIALVRLNPRGERLAEVRDAIIRVYNDTPAELPLQQRGGIQMQLLAGLRQLYDPSTFDFFRTVMQENNIPDIKITAINAVGLLANAAEAAALRTFVTETIGGATAASALEANETILAAATECDEDVTCWIGKLTDADENVARKATFMLARFARGNDAAMTALIQAIGSQRILVRLEALAAIDWLADTGNAEAVTRLEELRDTEQGRRIWNEFRPVAMVTLGRLDARSSGN